MPITEVPALPLDDDVKDLRLALVCYGGVSLAVYMHGVTKEIHKLVVASKAFEANPDVNPFAANRVEHVYFDALARRRKREGCRTRVVVDIIAGTSAGGINGICLAKALGHNLSQDALRDLWLKKGDIKQLIAMPRAPWIPLRVAAWVVKSVLTRKLRAPLDGLLMFTWVKEALDEMDSTAAGRESDEPDTLLPSGHALDLKVPITDFYGINRDVPTYDPRRVTDRWHRHVMRFRSVNGTGQLEHDHNHRLAFAARATSCFPVAFPPVSVKDLGEEWPGRDSFTRDFFPGYRLAEELVENTYFVDGGVLDNFPFKIAFESIREKAASVEVDRRLLYVQPDPGGPGAPAPGTPPNLRKLAWGGVAAIPRKEPILQDLLEIRAFNERVARVNAILDRAEEQVESLLPAGLDAEAYAEANETLVGTAMAELGLLYRAYVRLKLYDVVERFAELANAVCDFPPDSNHAFFVRDALLCWARKKQILEPPEGTEEPTDAQIAFLKSFDLAYGERRIRFAVRALNKLYEDVDGSGRPTRADLNATKRALYERIEELSVALAGEGLAELVAAVEAIFSPEAVRRWFQREGSPDAALEEFVDEHLAELDDIRDRIAAHLERQLQGFGDRVYKTIWEETGGWSRESRRKLLSAYVGFPFWDVLVFPVQEVGDVGELNRVEVIRVSPKERTLDRPDGAPLLAGIAIMHFGAFFKRDWRENDYLWGRLDGAGRLLGMLGEKPSDLYGAAFRTIADEERDVLTEIPELFAWVDEKVAELERAREPAPVPA